MANKEEIRAIFLGDSKTGKTSIIYQLCHFDLNNIAPTYVSYQESYVFNNQSNTKNVVYSLVDVSGLEKYRSLASLFSKDCQLMLLVYSIDNKKSFDSIKTFWYNLCKDSHEKPCMINK